MTAAPSVVGAAAPHRPLLSVGLPVFNGARYLEDSLRSILGQSFTDFELIICDNASTDETEEICRRHLSDPRVVYHRNDVNIGGFRNHNLTFEMAHGKYFRFAAHDDVCGPELFAECVAALERDPLAAISYTTTDEIDADGELIGCSLPWRGGSAEPDVRFRELASFDHACEAMYGVIRADLLGTTALMRSYSNSDRALLCELALRGRFVGIERALFEKRYHTQNVYVDMRARMKWSNPDRDQKITLPMWYFLYQLYESVVRVRPLSLRQRLSCIGTCIKLTARCWKSLAADVAVSAQRLVLPRSRRESWRTNWM